MKLLIIIPFLFLISCSKPEFYSIEQSEYIINSSRPKIDSLNLLINKLKGNISPERDLSIKIRNQVLNKLLRTFAFNRNDDISITFQQTKPVFSENKSTIGINYTNLVNIDTGGLKLDIKSLAVDKLLNRNLYATIELEGSGQVSVSGKYAGIPASASPKIDLYLKEPVVFDMQITPQNTLSIKPLSKKVILKSKISLKLLQWEIPIYKEIPLEITELLKPIEFPLSIKSDILFPLPTQTIGDNKIEMVPYIIETRDCIINSTDNALDVRFNVSFQKK